MGTGGIAHAFATDLALLPDARIVAVGSRTQASADAFADRFDIPRRHASYADLASDPDVDAVYVATPHPDHHRSAQLAIQAGKATLVEKPFTVNAFEALDLISEARTRQTFLMEAMWTRFLPHVVRIREIIGSGRIGEVRSLTADFGSWSPPDPTHRSYDPELGGGALLDLGIYPVSFASMLFGTPTSVLAASHPAFTGVDAQTSVILAYAGGQQAVLLTSLEARTSNRASINGTRARIEIDADFFAPTTFRVIDLDGREEPYDVPHEGRGLRHQAAEVGRCLAASLTESPVLPLSETLAVMETLDAIRRQIGLTYPSEQPGPAAGR
jgi:predicted dehydrogenase